MDTTKLARCSLLVLLGCYPDSDKLRHFTPVGTGGTGGPGGIDAAAGVGGADAGPSPDLGPLLPPGSSADNCTDFGAAWCEKSRQCQTEDNEDLGGPTLCPGRMKIWCETELGAPADSNWNAASFKTCITSWSALTCDEWRDFDEEILRGPSCNVPGKRAEGAGCWSFSQCGSGECLGDAVCGTCRQRVAADGACQRDSQCQRGLVCGQSHCVVPMTLGGACSDARPCRRSLLCRNGACAAKATEGSTCAAHTDCAGGLLCNFDKFVCGRAIASDTRCSGAEPDGSVLYCAAGSTCAQDTSMCVPTAADGQSCSANGPPACLWPAFCAAGTCRLNKPFDCPVQPPDGGS